MFSFIFNLIVSLFAPSAVVVSASSVAPASSPFDDAAFAAIMAEQAAEGERLLAVATAEANASVATMVRRLAEEDPAKYGHHLDNLVDGEVFLIK